MNPRTEIVFVVDSSTSMRPYVDDTIHAFNGFIDKQRAIAGDATITLVLFHRHVHEMLAGARLNAVPEMDRDWYITQGGTALYDAVGRTIDRTVARHQRMETLAPAEVVFVIITDGDERSSCLYTRDEVAASIETRRAAGWRFLYLGANADPFRAAAELSIPLRDAARWSHDAAGVQMSFESAHAVVSEVRTQTAARWPAIDSSSSSG